MLLPNEISAAREGSTEARHKRKGHEDCRSCTRHNGEVDVSH